MMIECSYLCERGKCHNPNRGWCFETNNTGGLNGVVSLGDICCGYCNSKPCRFICNELLNY